MYLAPAEAIIKVWTNLPHPALIETNLFGLTKIDPETNETEEVGLMDFFPVLQ